MSRICELTGAGVMSGHNVSHSQRKTKRKFLPNLHFVTLSSDLLKMDYRLRVAAGALRAIEINGGFDSYLLTTKDEMLSSRAKIIKKQIKVRKLEAAK